MLLVPQASFQIGWATSPSRYRLERVSFGGFDVPTFTHTAAMPVSQDHVWSWYDAPEAFVRIMPEWERLTPLELGALEDGASTRFRMHLGPLRPVWVARHHDVVKGQAFSDRMERGPFGAWDHEHRITAKGAGSSVDDTVTWRLPFHMFTGWTAPITVLPRLRTMFAFRSRRVRLDLKRIEETAHLPRRRVLVSGSTGLIGTQLCAFFHAAGHEVVRLLRTNTKLPAHLKGQAVVRWDDRTGEVVEGSLEGFDAVVHLAGAGIGDRRWSRSRMDLIRTSRTGPTALLAERLAALKHPPEVLLSGSAVGIYGNRPEGTVDETAEVGRGFLDEVALDWESATAQASESGIRVVHLRTGLVMTAAGGVLAKQLLPAKLGAGGPLGSGRQQISWISIDDEVHAIHHLMMHETAEGPYNLTSPQPVAQREFARTLGRVLRRPAFAPLPGFVLRVLFGRMARPLLLEGQAALPTRLIESGYTFAHPDLESCLRHTLGRTPADPQDAHEHRR
jgi:uncharacterized protein (TIGR01777 family)